MFYRNRLLFGLVKTVLTTVWQVVYGVICFLNLQPVLIVILLWVLLYFTGITEKYSAADVLLCLAFVAAVVYAVLTCIKQLLGLGKKKTPKARRGAEKIKNGQPEKAQVETTATAEDQEKESGVKQSSAADKVTDATPEQPKYYRVKQNASLIMAEYSDKYELYKIADGKLLKIRTDYKG